MKIELRPTNTIENVNGAPARQWIGMADTGTPVVAWVSLIRADHEHSSQSQIDAFNDALYEVQTTRQAVVIDNRYVL